MDRIILTMGIALILPLHAATAAPKAAKAKSVANGATVRMCQSYRIEGGNAVKVGGPHPCKEPKQMRISLASIGGTVLPQ
jgi:hypothetical protein